MATLSRIFLLLRDLYFKIYRNPTYNFTILLTYITSKYIERQKYSYSCNVEIKKRYFVYY